MTHSTQLERAPVNSWTAVKSPPLLLSHQMWNKQTRDTS